LRSKLAPENEDLDPIFEVKFVNEAGKYEPGRLAEAERKKLPPDAIAIVQQMVLWSPTDARLYWQLGELYAAQGKFIEAKKILDECVSEARHYSNHKILMEHRAVIMPLAESQAKQRSDSDASDDPPPSQPAVPIDLGTVWIYFGIVAAVVLLAVVRAVIRKPRSMRGISR
jgi:cytochrome c-type biogenesis protein CcmH/NrfG